MKKRYTFLFMKRLLIIAAIILSYTGFSNPMPMPPGSEVAAINATVTFSTTTPKSGEEFFMEIRINSSSLGSESGIVENMHVVFDLPAKLCVISYAEPLGAAFTVNMSGSHVDVAFTNPVPIGALQSIRFILAWDAGVTIAGVHTWQTPTITVNALNCIGTTAAAPNGIDPAQGIFPTNNAPINYMTAETQNVYAALLHIATVKLYNEAILGGLNLHNGKITLNFDAEAYIPTFRLNGAAIPVTPMANTPTSGRTTVEITIPDNDLMVDGNPWENNSLQFIYNYPTDVTLDPFPLLYDIFITFTAQRENGVVVSNTKTIHEEIEYNPPPGLLINCFNAVASERLVRVPENPISWILSFDPVGWNPDVDMSASMIMDPEQNEPDFFNAFRFSRFEITAYDPFMVDPVIGRVRTKVFYESSNAPNVWVPAPNTEVTAPGTYQYSWGGVNLSSTALGLGQNYVTRVKFEFYDDDGVSTTIAQGSGKVEIRVFAVATQNIQDNTTSNSYNNDSTVTNTVTVLCVQVDKSLPPSKKYILTADLLTHTRLVDNRPLLYWAFQPACWYYANGGSLPQEINSSNAAGGGAGFVRIGDEVWVTEFWLLEGGYFHDPIVYFHVPDPNLEILGIATGNVLNYSDVEYFDAPNGGRIVKFKIKNTVDWMPGNPEVPAPTSGWNSYLPAFGPGDPGNYGWSWGHWWVRSDHIALKLKFKPGVQNSNSNTNIRLVMTSGDPEQIGSSKLSGSDLLVTSGAAISGQTFLSERYFGYTIDRTAGLTTTATVSKDNITFKQIETIDNLAAPVDVYLKMSIENPQDEIYGYMSKLRAIDALPWNNDLMTTSNAPKGSTDSLINYFIQSVTVDHVNIPLNQLTSNGISLYYSTTANYITNRSELRDVTAAVASHWTPIAGNTFPQSAKAIMIEKNGFAMGELLELTLKATAAADSKTNKFWHSIAAGGRFSATNIIPGEPLKAGITAIGANSVTVSGRVWTDTDKDGVQDVGESGYPDLEMVLYDDQNNPVDFTITDANGGYAFTNDFTAGATYYIKFALPDQYSLTQYHAPAATNTTNSDFIIYMGNPTAYFTVATPAGNITHLDAGIYDENNTQRSIFKIWNWADLAYLKVLLEENRLSEYEAYLLMQDLGVPQMPETYGKGIFAPGTPNERVCPYEDLRKEGWYGYENWIDDAGYTGNIFSGNQSLKVGGTASAPVATITNCTPTGAYCWNENGWNPIAFNNSFFWSLFDGQNFTINNLWMDRNSPNQGLFGSIHYDAAIQNITINISDKVRGTSNVGALAGRVCAGATLTNCHAVGTGKVEATANYSYAGGLVGDISGFCFAPSKSFTNEENKTEEKRHRDGLSYAITDCSASVEVRGVNYVGGLIGDIGDINIKNNYATGKVTGAQSVGGLIGGAFRMNIINNHAAGQVTGSYKVGGLIGSVESAFKSIEQNYATGDVEGNGDLGGLVGYLSREQLLSCYATGNVTQYDEIILSRDGNETRAFMGGIGGLVGNMYFADIDQCYATGTVSGEMNNRVGGLVGYLNACPIVSKALYYIKNSFALNPVISTYRTSSYIGRIVGSFACADLLNNYALECMEVICAPTLPSKELGERGLNDKNGADITTKQAKSESTYTDAGWLFNDIWRFNYNNFRVIKESGKETNLPILAVFTEAQFPKLIQPPHVKDCYPPVSFTLHGTVFPFVHDTLPNGAPDDDFNRLFTVTARLYAVPQGSGNVMLALFKATPLHESNAVYYDGSVFVSTTPLHPGEIGSINNPGIPILWDNLGITQGRIDSTKVVDGGALPDKPVGLYTFNKVEEGWYILTLSATGFVTRYAKIFVGSAGSMGHRELIGGDFNNDGIIDQRDATLGNSMKSSYLESKYNINFDLNHDRKVDEIDIELVVNNFLGFTYLYYFDTHVWMFGY